MELIFIFTGAFVVALSGALMPGPMLTLTIAHSLKRGFFVGPQIVFGHMILEIVLIIGLLLGLQKFFQVKIIQNIIFILGGAILIAMGLDLALHFKKTFIETGREQASSLNFHPIINGIIISLSNPYWTVWWITIGLGYLIKAMKYKFTGVLLFFSGHILADFLWYSFVAFSFSRGKKFIKEKVYQMIILICGLFLICFGVWFLYSGIII